MEDRNPVEEWAKVRLAVREAHAATLKAHGLDYNSFKALEQQALAVLLEQTEAPTEYGTVRVLEKPAHACKNPQPLPSKHYLSLDRKV